MPRRNSGLAVATVILLAMSIGVSAGMPAAADDTRDNVTPVSPAADLNARLRRVETLSADFHQVTRGPDGRVVQQNGGRLWFEGPARFRIESEDSAGQVLVSDGTDFWTYDADLDQVIVRELEADVRQVPILLLGGDATDVMDAYEVDYYRDEQAEHFVLRPRSPDSLFDTLSLEFAGEVPSAISLRDSLGQNTRIELAGVDVNRPMAPSRFTFEAPQGVDVIDDRAPD